MVTPTPKIWRFRKVHVSSDIFRLGRRITKGVGVEGRVATYRCAHHHPVIPMARVENLESHVEPQGKTGSGNRECYELDNDEGRTPGLGVDVIRGRPRGHNLRRREPHIFGRGGVCCVVVAVGGNHKHQGLLLAPANGHARHVRAWEGLLFGWILPTSRPQWVVLEPR